MLVSYHHFKLLTHWVICIVALIFRMTEQDNFFSHVFISAVIAVTCYVNNINSTSNTIGHLVNTISTNIGSIIMLMSPTPPQYHRLLHQVIASVPRLCQQKTLQNCMYTECVNTQNVSMHTYKDINSKFVTRTECLKPYPHKIRFDNYDKTFLNTTNRTINN